MDETFEEIISEVKKLKAKDDFYNRTYEQIIPNNFLEGLLQEALSRYRAHLEKQIQEELANHKEEVVSGKTPREADELQSGEYPLAWKSALCWVLRILKAEKTE